MPVSRAAQRRWFRFLVALSVLALAPMGWAQLASSGLRFTAGPGPGWPDAVPAAPVALVLGAAVWPTGPSPLLARRLDIAAELYRAGRVRALLLSGNGHDAPYPEPPAMRDYLVARGVPERVMVLDPAGLDTWDSCVRAREVFGAGRVIVVSQRFHLPRAVALCRAAGLDAVGVGDDSARRRPLPAYGYALREVAAAGKAFLDAVVLRSEPRFPGPRRPAALRRALAR